MKMARKVLALMLALVMMLNVFALCSSADFAGGDTLVHLTVEADKASFEKGEEVTFTVKAQTRAEAGNINAQSQICFGYDSSVLEPISANETISEHGFVIGSDFASGYVPAISKVWSNDLLKSNGVTLESANNWDKMIGVVVACNNCWVDASSSPVTLYSFKMRVKADATATSTVFGVNDNCWDDWWGILNNVNGDLYSQDAASAGYSVPYMYDGDIVNLTIGAPAAASILKYSKSQIRFKGITATSGPSTYEGTFDVRTVAKISQADFLATFTSEENAKAKITDFGFVYAAKSKVASFNVDTAKSVAEGATVENYVKAPVTYMQHTGDGADYIFTCLITNIQDADKTDGVNCLAYVCFDGNYIYFDAAESVDYSTLYALMPVA